MVSRSRDDSDLLTFDHCVTNGFIDTPGLLFAYSQTCVSCVGKSEYDQVMKQQHTTD